MIFTNINITRKKSWCIEWSSLHCLNLVDIICVCIYIYIYICVCVGVWKYLWFQLIILVVNSFFFLARIGVWNYWGLVCKGQPRAGVSLYYYFYYSLRVFHISVSWLSFTGVWVTASLFKSPGLFSVFWPISIIQLFQWSPLVLLFPSTLSLYHSFDDCTKSTNYNWYKSHFHIPRYPSKVEILILLFTLF